MTIVHGDFFYEHWDPKQKAQAFAALTGALTGFSSFSRKRGMPSFRKKNNYISRNNKRQRVATWSRARARIQARNARRPTERSGITYQHDTRTVYRRKRMPRRKRRMWKRFTKKVQWIDEKNLGTRTVLFNVTRTITESTSGRQGLLGLCLYGWESTDAVETWGNDLKYMANLENRAAGNPTNGDTVYSNSKMFFHSGVLDVTLRNSSAKDGALDPAATLEVDIYTMSSPVEFEIDGVNYYTLANALNQTMTGIYDNNVPVLGTAAQLINRGVSPFEITKGLSSFRFKVLKKTKYYLGSGQTLTFQVRDPRRHQFYRDKVDGLQNGPNMPGITKWYLVIFKAVPGITVGAAAGQTQQILDAGVTRKYMYKTEGLMEDRNILRSS